MSLKALAFLQKNKKEENIPDEHKIPKNLINEYTLNGKIEVMYKYIDGRNELHKKIWEIDYINSYIRRFTKNNILRNKQGDEPYKDASLFICQALNNYDLSNKKVAIIGSTSPWVEAIIINHSCKDITTIEYNKPESNHPYIKTIEYDDIYKLYSTNSIEETEKFDFVITYSSIEHSGLGRYGDPLNPNADIETMDLIHKLLKSDGILLWGAPVGGNDVVTWNAHRVYGKIRLPIIFKKFKVLEWFGLKKEVLNINKTARSGFGQPVILCSKINQIDS